MYTLYTIYIQYSICAEYVNCLVVGGFFQLTYTFLTSLGFLNVFFITFELWLYGQRLSVTVLPTFVIRYFYSEAVCKMLCQRLYVHILRYFFISKDVCSDQLFFLPRFWLKTITTFVLFNFFIQ